MWHSKPVGGKKQNKTKLNAPHGCKSTAPKLQQAGSALPRNQTRKARFQGHAVGTWVTKETGAVAEGRHSCCSENLLCLENSWFFCISSYPFTLYQMPFFSDKSTVISSHFPRSSILYFFFKKKWEIVIGPLTLTCLQLRATKHICDSWVKKKITFKKLHICIYI